MNVSKSKITNLTVILNSIFICISVYITNGKDQIILLYPIPTIIVLVTMIVFNTKYMYCNAKETKMNNLKSIKTPDLHVQIKRPNKTLIFLLVSLILSFPLIDNYLIIYILMGAMYFIGFLFSKRIGMAILCSAFVTLITFASINTYYLGDSNNYFKAINERVDFGYSPSKKLYGYCLDNIIYIRPKKKFIELLELFFSDSPDNKMMTIGSSCNKIKIKWKSDKIIEIDGESIEIIHGKVIGGTMENGVFIPEEKYE